MVHFLLTVDEHGGFYATLPLGVNRPSLPVYKALQSHGSCSYCSEHLSQANKFTSLDQRRLLGFLCHSPYGLCQQLMLFIAMECEQPIQFFCGHKGS